MDDMTELEQLRASLKVALHDLQKLQAEVDAKPQGPTPAYGQCASCGIFSEQAKFLHDYQRKLRDDASKE